MFPHFVTIGGPIFEKSKKNYSGGGFGVSEDLWESSRTPLYTLEPRICGKNIERIFISLKRGGNGGAPTPEIELLTLNTHDIYWRTSFGGKQCGDADSKTPNQFVWVVNFQ